MVQWTPLFSGMIWLRLIILFVGMVWLRHLVVTLVILMRDINVERGSYGVYRLSTFQNGMETSVQLHGETQGELSKKFIGEISFAEIEARGLSRQFAYS